MVEKPLLAPFCVPYGNYLYNNSLTVDSKWGGDSYLMNLLKQKIGFTCEVYVQCMCVFADV